MFSFSENYYELDFVYENCIYALQCGGMVESFNILFGLSSIKFVENKILIFKNEKF